MLRKFLNIASIAVIALYNIYNSAYSYAEPLTMEGTTVSDVVNIRQEPKPDSQIVLSLKKGIKITITGSNENRTWYQVSSQNKKGWVSKESLMLSFSGNINYNTVSVLGSVRDQGILTNALKIAVNPDFVYILDNSDKIRLKIYDKNHNFLKSIELNYLWIQNEADLEKISFTVDEEQNIYTNTSDKDELTKYDFNGQINGEIKKDVLGELSQIFYDPLNKLLYSLDAPHKTIKAIEKNGKSVANIFLSETRIPKYFSVYAGNIYVLDYPENPNEYFQVYSVNSYSFSLRENYDEKAKVIENISKGSILKYNPQAKTFKSKVFSTEDPSKTNEMNWIEFEENGIKQYGNLDELKKINFMGEIDVYSINGLPQNTISLQKKLLLTTPDRSRDLGSNEIFKKLLGISVLNDGTFILPVATTQKNSNFFSLNYYYLNKDSFKISQPLPVNNKGNFTFTSVNSTIFSLNSRGYFTILNENGYEKGKIGRINPGILNLPSKLSFNNNKLFVFDKGTFSLGLYDLNGEARKAIYSEQGTDVYDCDDIFFSDSNIYMLKTLQSEEKKLGLDLFDYNLNKISDKWLISIDSSSKPKIAVNDKKETFIAAKGSFLGKKIFLSMFNDKLQIINRWSDEAELVNLFPESAQKNIRAIKNKFLGFDNQANIYLMTYFQNNEYRIQKIKIKTNGKGEILKTLEVKFFGDLITSDKGKNETREFHGTINGDVLNIETGKNNFTYFLFKESNKSLRIGIYDPTGIFWKEFYLNDYPQTSSFTLDNQDNVWLSDGTNIKKLATYK